MQVPSIFLAPTVLTPPPFQINTGSNCTQRGGGYNTGALILAGVMDSSLLRSGLRASVLLRRRWAARSRTHLCQVVDGCQANLCQVGNGKDTQQDVDASAVLLVLLESR